MPKFLVNKWLNVSMAKSKFGEDRCKIDNPADISEYSVTTRSNKNVLSPKLSDQQISAGLSKFATIVKSPMVKLSARSRSKYIARFGLP